MESECEVEEDVNEDEKSFKIRAFDSEARLPYGIVIPFALPTLLLLRLRETTAPPLFGIDTVSEAGGLDFVVDPASVVTAELGFASVLLSVWVRVTEVVVIAGEVKGTGPAVSPDGFGVIGDTDEEDDLASPLVLAISPLPAAAAETKRDTFPPTLSEEGRIFADTEGEGEKLSSKPSIPKRSK